MFAVDVCNLPATGGSTGFVFVGVFVLIAGVMAMRWVRSSAGRLSVVVAPIVLLGGLVLTPSLSDPCAPTTTVAATTTLAPALYSVGDPGPGGGTIFYVDMTRAEGSRYFEVACLGWQNSCDDSPDPLTGWGCSGTAIEGADETAIGTGELNTAQIVNGCADVGIAAKLADGYSNNDFDDWFLPSKDELNALCKWAFNDAVNAVCNDWGYANLTLTDGGFSTDFYLSSSETDDASAAWAQYFGTGIQFRAPKSDGTISFRPMRAF